MNSLFTSSSSSRVVSSPLNSPPPHPPSSRSYSRETCIAALAHIPEIPSKVVEINPTGLPSLLTSSLQTCLHNKYGHTTIPYSIIDGSHTSVIDSISQTPTIVVYPDCFHSLSLPTPRRFMNARSIAGVGGSVVLIWKDPSKLNLNEEEEQERERKIEDVWVKFEHFLGNYFGSPKRVEKESEVVYSIPVIA
jgi:hypothetical protein